MYAKELLKCGTEEDFCDAAAFFEALYQQSPSEEPACVLCRYYRQKGEIDRFEQKMCLGEIKRYLSEVEKEDNGNFYVDQIGMHFNELKNA